MNFSSKISFSYEKCRQILFVPFTLRYYLQFMTCMNDMNWNSSPFSNYKNKFILHLIIWRERIARNWTKSAEIGWIHLKIFRLTFINAFLICLLSWKIIKYSSFHLNNHWWIWYWDYEELLYPYFKLWVI